MFITPSFKKSLIVEQFLGNYLNVLVVGKSADHDKPHFDLFFTTISTSKKMFFFFSEREKSAS